MYPSWEGSYTYERAKNPIKFDGYNHHIEDKTKGQKGQKMHIPHEPKKGES
jgi:hypothetical protein